MRQRSIPLLAPVTKHRQNGDGFHETKARGLAVLNSPVLNKGTAFTAEERQTLGLTVGIRLVKPVDAIAGKSRFCERVDDGLMSIPTFDCIQEQLERISKHASPLTSKH